MNVKNILDKIKIALECDTYIDISNKLEVTPGAVDNWKKRNTIPNKYLLKVVEDTGVSLDWLIDEEKPTFHISGGTKNIGQVNNSTIHQDSKKEDTVDFYEEFKIIEGLANLSKNMDYLKKEMDKIKSKFLDDLSKKQ